MAAVQWAGEDHGRQASCDYCPARLTRNGCARLCRDGHGGGGALHVQSENEIRVGALHGMCKLCIRIYTMNTAAQTGGGAEESAKQFPHCTDSSLAVIRALFALFPAAGWTSPPPVGRGGDL